MDPLTQVALGAAIGTVTIGRKVGARRGAVFGGVVAEMPDIDVFFPSATPLDAFVGHRGATHSIIMCALATPLFGELLARLDRRLQGHRGLVYGMAFLALSTHAILDAFTTYGTRLLWPFSDRAVSWSTVFIIDPLYTLPLLVAMIIALIQPKRPQIALRAATVGLVLSSAYLGWTVVAQQIARDRVELALDAAGVRYDRLKMIPMPFNSLLWRGLAIAGDRYANVYVSVLDEGPPAPVHEHPRNMALLDALPDRTPVRKIDAFSHGFFAMTEDGGAVLVRDLRMGIEPDYVFTFEIARYRSPDLAMIPPARLEEERDWSGLRWIWRRIFDEGAVRAE